MTQTRTQAARGRLRRQRSAAALALLGAVVMSPPLAAQEIAMSPKPTEPATATDATGDPFAMARARLLEAIALGVELTSAELGTDRLDPAVMTAIGQVPRERFVPEELREHAYRDRPLPIGRGQTISQPYIVAIMSHLLAIEPGDRVYELGTGSGYQAAVLGAMGAKVYSVEIVPELAEQAAATLSALGFDQVHVRAGDGYLGWPEAAPFDGIIVTAAGPDIPPPLIGQLKVGGRLVMPVGGVDQVQQLMVLTKQPDGSMAERRVLPVRFVPITGER